MPGSRSCVCPAREGRRLPWFGGSACRGWRMPFRCCSCWLRCSLQQHVADAERLMRRTRRARS